MSGRERVLCALRFARPDRAPRDLWHLPGIAMLRGAELSEMLRRFPPDLARPSARYARGDRERGEPGRVGTYADEWGCVWHAAEPGVVGEVKGAPLADWPAFDHYRPPFEVLRKTDLGPVDRECAASACFMLASTAVRPFERMQFLRGTERLLLDLARRPAALDRLRDMVHDFFCREIEMWTRTAVDGIAFMDDWGTQRGLLIAPELWRALFRPLYADYCRIIHAAGKFVFFHSDGHIAEIIPDLIEIGVDALNAQLFCMDIEQIGRRHRGRIAFWGEIDRQRILPFGDTAEVRAAVRRVRRALDDGRGGLFAQCEWGIGVPAANVAAVFEEWLLPASELAAVPS